MIWLLTVTEVR